MHESNKIDLLLIYPPLGCWDNIIRDIPLSLLYAAAASVKAGYKIKILDLRIKPYTWKSQIREHINGKISLVGFSVMTGMPIKNSLEISNYIKKNYPYTSIIWGGAHPSVLPEQTLENEYIDFIIRDWGSESLLQFLNYIFKKNTDIDKIKGLGYKKDGKIFLNQPHKTFELISYKDIPYDLVDIKAASYYRINNDGLLIPIFTSMGCPYECTFCIAPSLLKKISGRKWVPFSVEEIIDHINFLINKYNLAHLQIYDDDSFVDLNRMEKFFRELINRNFYKSLSISFRGIRIDELDRMDDDFLDLMSTLKIDLLLIGIESGSNRILKKIKKGITREQIIRVNKRLAKYPSIKPRYNYFCGVPGETYEDLLETKSLLIQLINDNPNCYLGTGSDWKPIPGSELTNEAVNEFGLKLPQSLEEWGEIDSYDAKKIYYPWYTSKFNNMIKLLQVFATIYDCKLTDFKKNMGWMGDCFYIMSKIYRPFLKLRIKYNFTHFLWEHYVLFFVHARLGQLLKFYKNKNF